MLQECIYHLVQFSLVLSRVRLFATPWTVGFPVYQLLELAQTHVHWVSDPIQPSHPLSPSSPPAFDLSQHQSLFQWVVFHIRWLKYWSFSFSISPSNEYSGLISFRMDWLDLLAVHGTLKRILQHHSSKASVLWRSAFFTVQLSHPYMTTGKTIALTRRTFDEVKLLSHVRLFATPWTIAYQAPLSMGFSRQEYWSRLLFLFPGDLPNLGIEPGSPTLQADALPI